MKVLERSTMPCGTKIQIEDWSDDYSFMGEATTIGAYPKSKISKRGQHSPKLNRTFRASFNLWSAKEAMKAFKALENGDKNLSDFKAYMNDKRNADCI